MLAQTFGRLLAEPVIAVVLGIAAGVGLLVFSRLSFRAMRPEAPEVGLALAAVMLLARMGLVAVAILGYRALSRHGYLPFAMSMAGGFLVAYTIELLRYGKLLRTRQLVAPRSR